MEVGLKNNEKKGIEMIKRKEIMKAGVICILFMFICNGCNMKTKRYLIPSNALFAQTDGQEGYISDTKVMNKDQNLFTDIRKSDDGGVIMVLTEEQKENNQNLCLKNVKKLVWVQLFILVHNINVYKLQKMVSGI
ncbi:hypothetical protein [Anaerosacchariphilus polymeriproducens]|uniref:Uncharacterized protein n=1 Tax=Anaerosacchariphilus polymeriproducens TaxID=1812858 RepID=A0A371AWF1_9FIRM|nr:hypothetical protein [Anaerosacchariphilus polymeriproducens]RDU23790.1 hypothetical protein DWV06_08000 [Anaerosacchariphilus polymeriproducens]